MGLTSGMVIGMIMGITVMFAWKQMMRYRSLHRVAKSVDIKLLGELNRDNLKKLCGDKFPEWISFPAFDQVKWLNKQISKLWPFVSEAAGPLIIYYVEPMLEAYRPGGIKSIKFDKIFLGNVPPKIEGIRVQSLNKGQIIMDIDLRWGGNLSIILAVDSLVASLPIQLKNLQVFTIARVVFHLSEEIPCVSALVAALLCEPKPRIEYTLKAVGGSLTAIPGISDMIDDIVQNMVTDMLEWPRRIVVPIGVGVDTSDLELKPQGELTLTVVKASSLKNMEKLGTSDPYMVMHIRPLFKVKTKVIDNNLNPVWNESFRLIVEDKETQAVIFQALDMIKGQNILALMDSHLEGKFSQEEGTMVVGLASQCLQYEARERPTPKTLVAELTPLQEKTEVASHLMLGISKHEQSAPILQGPQRPLSPLGEACSRMDLTAIHQILVMTHYRDDEGTKELSFQEWTQQMRDMLESRKRGDFAFRDKDSKTAIDCYTQFLDVGTMVSPTVYARRSLCYLLCDQPDAALRDAMQAQLVYPEWPTAFYMQAVALAKLDMQKDSVDMLNEAASQEAKQKGRNSHS